MTDVYISCTSEDAGQMKRVVDALSAEGWRVWFEPDASAGQRERAIDAELGAAGAVIVLWSDTSRESDYVRTEAATGLYRNKLIQVSFGGTTAPRPFDQLDTIDLSSWNGDASDSTFQRVVAAVRLFAGEPGADRPQVVRKSAAGFASQAASRPGRPQFGVASDVPHDRLPEADDPLPWDGEKQQTGSQAGSGDSAPVFDGAIEDAPRPSASMMDRAFGVPSHEASATVTPAGKSGSPIPEAVSAMERKISGVAAEPPKDAPTDTSIFEDAPAAEDEAAHAWDARPEASEPQTASYAPDHRGFDERFRDDRYPHESASQDGFQADSHLEPAAQDASRHEPLDDLFVRRSPPPGGEPPSYRPPKQSSASGLGPVVVVGLLAIVGGGLWFVDPMGWRQAEKAAFAESPAATPAAAEPAPSDSILAASGPLYDDPVAEHAWESVDREDPEALRTFIIVHRDSTSAETARAMLKVLDAQAWAEAVTADVERAYEIYLERFPPPTGDMTRAAASRLVALREERREALASIQTQLRELDLYQGASGGAADSDTQDAADRFASRHGGEAPRLYSASPRDLRRFADRLLEQVRAGGETVGNDPDVSVSALAVVTVPEPAVNVEAGASAADLPAEAFAFAEDVGQGAPVDDEQAGMAERLAAWESASQYGTVQAYATFIRDYPDTPRAESARAAIRQLSRPEGFSLDWLSADTLDAVEAARAAQARGRQRAGEAREVAAEADAIAEQARSGSAFASTVVAPDGDIYETQTSGNQPNGLGVRTSGDAESSGDRYRGRLSNGLAQGLGVYDYGDNPNNAGAQALRYAGENTNDTARGHGVLEWRNGNRFEGQSGDGGDSGVLVFANGQRYEGELLNGNRHGYGAFWSAEGDLMLAGRWENGDLVEPMPAYPGPDIAALVAAVTVSDTTPGPDEDDPAVGGGTPGGSSIVPTPASVTTPAGPREAAATEPAQPLQRSGSWEDARTESDQPRKWLRSGFGGGRRPNRF